MAKANSIFSSVALCTFNGEAFLPEQLESFCRQTDLPDEVVVCDDCSSDRTFAILEQWAASAPFPVRLFRNERNLGFSQNFQKTIERCEGEVIFLSDQDDVWLPQKLELMKKEFLQDPGLVALTCRVCYADEELKPFTQDELRRMTSTDVRSASAWALARPFPGCCLAIRKPLAEKVLPVPPIWPHDMWLQMTLPFWGAVKFLDTAEPLMIHRGHSQSITTREMRDSWYYGRNAFYCLSLGLFQQHKPLRNAFLERISGFPDGPYKEKCEACFSRQEKHFGNRLRNQKVWWGTFGALLEFCSGRYFGYSQPFKSFLFDLKENLLNLPGILRGGEKC